MRKVKKAKWLVVLMVVAMLVGMVPAMAAADLGEPDFEYDWEGYPQGVDSLDCTKAGEDGRPDDGSGWIHWLFNNKGASTDARLILYEKEDPSNIYGIFEPWETQAANWHFYTPYFDLETLGATVRLYGGDGASPKNLIISDWCSGEEDATLEVSIDLDYVWTVDWDWDIDKTVFPARWDLFKGDTGTSEYTVTVTRGENVEESALLGNFCVANISLSVDAENVVVTLDLYKDDVVLDGEQQTFNLGNIAVGADPVCRDFDFDIDLVEGAVYSVEMTVTLDNGGPYEEEDSITATENILGIDEVTVTDSWEGDLASGLTSSQTFTYMRTFDCASHEEDENADYMDGYWRFPNTAEIVETGDSDDAYVDIYCYELEIEKNAETTFDREHEWDIEKEVVTENNFTVDEDTPKVWLFIDGRYDETATWKVCVTYLGFEDSDWAVSGTISIHNPAPIDAVINSVSDVITAAGLDDIDADIDFGEGEDEITFPYTLAAEATLDLDYSAELPDDTDRDNEVKAVQQNFDYTYDYYNEQGELEATAGGTTEHSAEAAVTFGDPENEYLDVINIVDVSDFDFFGTQNFGPLNAADFEVGDDPECFDYDYFFAYGAYNGPAVINNTATIVETEQSASAILKINTQEFIYDSAWAKGDEEIENVESVVPFCEYFANWGWTNEILPGTYEWDLWAGAAQCDTDKGTLVGSVDVVYDVDGYVTVEYNLFEGYDLKETHVYAGYDMFPQQQRGRRTVNTVAPGQYYNDGPFDGSEVYVIAHAVVGIPDPDFGPDPVE